jgi:hypothetical protein
MRQLRAKESRGSAVIGGGFVVVLVQHDPLELELDLDTVFACHCFSAFTDPSRQTLQGRQVAFSRTKQGFLLVTQACIVHVTVVQSQVAVDMDLSNDFCHGWEASDKERKKI